MIFWNALWRIALSSCVACVINRRSRAFFGRIRFDETRCVVPASATVHIPYGHKNTQSERQSRAHASEICGDRQVQDRVARAAAGFATMGGFDTAPDDRRRKNRPTALHNVSRHVHVDGLTCISADATRRNRFACRRIYSDYPHDAAGNREKPNLPDGGAEQPIASQIEVATADWSRLRTRVGHAP